MPIYFYKVWTWGCYKTKNITQKHHCSMFAVMSFTLSLFYSILTLAWHLILRVFRTVLDSRHPSTCCSLALPVFQHMGSHAERNAARTRKRFPNMCSVGLLINAVAWSTTWALGRNGCKRAYMEWKSTVPKHTNICVCLRERWDCTSRKVIFLPLMSSTGNKQEMGLL